KPVPFRGYSSCVRNLCADVFMAKENTYNVRFREMSADGKWKTLKTLPLVTAYPIGILFDYGLEYFVTIGKQGESASDDDIVIYDNNGRVVRKINRNQLLPKKLANSHYTIDSFNPFG